MECFCHDEKTAGFAALEHIAEFKDGKAPVQLIVMGYNRFEGKGFDDFLMSQMWDCMEDRERIFRECQHQVVATDMLAAALPALERANLDMDFLDALAELYPTAQEGRQTRPGDGFAVGNPSEGFPISPPCLP